jgi:formylglycine-generating enzyme required for sulfatase activity
MNDGTTGYGGVGYNYSIGKYEVTNAQWNAFVAAAGAPTGNPSEAYNSIAYYTGIAQPTNRVSWYEALQFCNYLTSGDKSQGAYLFSGDNANPGDFLRIERSVAIAAYGTIYVLPTEDEWYKAAYWTGSGYSLYANGTNTAPVVDVDSNYYSLYFPGTYSIPWDVGTGTEEQNGTFDMMGNVREWNETLVDSIYDRRGIRGGSYDGPGIYSSNRDDDNPYDEGINTEFRVVEIVPVPSAFLLGTLGLSVAGWKLRRHKAS